MSIWVTTASTRHAQKKAEDILASTRPYIIQSGYIEPLVTVITV